MHKENTHNHDNPRNVFWIITGLITLVIILALAFFTHQSLRLDEAQSLWQTSHTPTKILNILAQDVHVPFYHFFLHFWQLFLGNNVMGGRILSLIFFVLSIPAMFVFGRRTFGTRSALFATTLFAISPFMNWYASEMRMYTLFTLLTILSHYFYIGIYKTREKENWVGYLITALFGVYTHYFFWFVLLVHALFYFSYRNLFPKGSLKKFIIVAVVVLLAFSPWIYYVKYLGTIEHEAPLLVRPTSINVFNTFSQFLFGFQDDHLNTLIVSLWPLTVLMGFFALRENKRVSPETILMVMSILVPIVAAFLVSVTLRPLFVSRYLILTIPALYLFIGWVVSTYPPTLRKTIQAILIIVMIAGLAVEIISPSTPTKENYREAAAYLEQKASPQDIIILSAPFTIYPMDYYYKGSTEIETLPIWNRFASGPIPPFVPGELPGQVQTVTDSHEVVWLLLSYDQGYEEELRQYFDSNYHRIESQTFSPGLTLYAYRLRYDDHVLGYIQAKPQLKLKTQN